MGLASAKYRALPESLINIFDQLVERLSSVADGVFEDIIESLSENDQQDAREKVASQMIAVRHHQAG